MISPQGVICRIAQANGTARSRDALQLGKGVLAELTMPCAVKKLVGVHLSLVGCSGVS
jgi:hypothetical protein